MHLGRHTPQGDDDAAQGVEAAAVDDLLADLAAEHDEEDEAAVSEKG